jgi:hypothetical protein
MHRYSDSTHWSRLERYVRCIIQPGLSKCACATHISNAIIAICIDFKCCSSPSQAVKMHDRISPINPKTDRIHL